MRGRLFGLKKNSKKHETNTRNPNDQWPDDKWVAKLRAELPAVQSCAYLNTGTAGPIPRRTKETIEAETDREFREGRGNFATWDRFFAQRERTRERVATLVHADSQEVALTHHTSEGVNIVLWGTHLRPGESIVTTELEHDAVAVPFALLRDRLGVEIRFADIGRGERTLDGLAAAIDETTRLVVVSHIVWSTGALLPLAELIRMVHQSRAAVLVDGAQSAGVLPVDFRDLGADYYTVSGQKWLCGPEGTGALVVRRDRLEHLQPTFASYFSSARHDYRGNVEFHQGAKRFETGMVYRPALAGFESSLQWILEDVGVEEAWRRSIRLARRCRSELSRLSGLELLTPETLQSPLVSFDLPDFAPAQLHGLADMLADQGVIVRSIDCRPFALRASLGFFNTDEDIDLLVTSLKRAIKKGPEAVPIQGWALKLPRSR